MSGSNLVLELATEVSSGATISLYINKGFTTASNTNASTDEFEIDAVWASTKIIEDTTTNAADKKFTATAAITGSITVPTLTMSTSNAGEASDYTLSFTSSTGYDLGDKIEIYFPDAFDPFVGHASVWFLQEAGVYYLNCSSSTLSLVWCMVDKWKVTVSGSAAVEDNGTVDVTIHHVWNPTEGTTTDKLQVAVVNSEGVYQSHNVDFNNGGIVTTAAPDSNISIKSVTTSNHNLFSGSNTYEFKFFVDKTTFTTTENLAVMFPMQYELHLCDGADSYTCATTLADSTGANVAEEWNTDKSCEADMNWVKLGEVGYTLESTDEFTWEISGVGNPQMALTRTAPSTTWDFDATDTTLFTAYTGWTEKFDIYSYDSNTKAYTGRSYGNLNSAYLGFNYQYDQITVNNGNRVTVWAGSYTGDIPIKASTNNGMMASAKVTLTPSANTRSRRSPDAKLGFKSPIHNFIFFSETNEIHFRVGADISLEKGLYYIDWSITEEGHSTNSSDKHYHEPAKTTVEVVGEKANHHDFTVDAPLSATVYKGTKSADIAVRVANAPFSDVTVSLALSVADENIVFNPASLLFNADNTERYFNIEVKSDYDIQTANPRTIVFTTAGTDATVFEAPSNLSFNVADQPSDTTAGQIS